MKLIVTHSIKKIELEPVIGVFSFETIRSAARKSFLGIGQSIKNTVKIPSTILKKLSLTSPGGAGRIVFLLKIDSQKAVLVLIRQKNDKRIGANITVKNYLFKKVLEKNLDLIFKDLEKGNYKEYEL